MSDALCAVCSRREPTRGQVCDTDRARLAAQLAELPANLAALEHQLVPSRAGAAQQRVNVTRVDAPAPLRVDVLSLSGRGSEDTEWMPALAVLHPAVRRWTTRHTVVVERLAGRQVVQEERTITCWHQELILCPGGSGTTCPCGNSDLHTDRGRRVLIAHDDQIGVIPPREWLDIWTRRFRRHFGHHVPQRTFRRPAEQAQPLEADERRRRARTVLGLVDGSGPVADRPDDPVAAEWEIRFGVAPRHQAMVADVRYLLTWLDAACDNHPDIGLMAAELRSLTAEMERILGETPDQQWLGRCPTVLVDRADDTRRACGAGLWQDPYAQQVRCPRCASTWGPDPRHLLGLARDIRTRWPLDRRRRYTSGERSTLPTPACAGCGKDLQVQWKDVTTPADKQRWWRYTGVSCTSGCADAGKGV